MESLPNIREAPCRAIHPPTLPPSQSLIYIVKPDQTLVIISEIISVLDNGPELISLEVVLEELVVLHNYSGAPGLVRGGPAEIKSPCLDVSQDIIYRVHQATGLTIRILVQQSNSANGKGR